MWAFSALARGQRHQLAARQVLHRDCRRDPADRDVAAERVGHQPLRSKARV